MKENITTPMETGEIILYNPNDTIRLEVRMENETVWLTQAQMAELFDTKPQNITMHIRNVYEENELEEQTTCKDFLQVQKEGNRLVKRKNKTYNLDVIISVGYRVKSPRGTKFRQWAIDIIKKQIQSNSSIQRRITNIEHTLYDQQQKIDFFIRTSLPPIEGVFFENQIFDAYVFVSNLIKSATKSIILIDNYINESILTLLDKRNENVSATIYTHRISTQLQLDIEKHNAQYQHIEIKTYEKTHDRFLLIDNDIYHIGASIKDLGKKLFAFSKLTEFTKTEILKKLL